ncbi:HK97 family phage prohead protease [uncultured Parasphingopyxis sp.]|uniref:HK97 family phage prohead protease n=1 Tax=uncultured Parasphingopyxis sp. TaxID=1547918 RepID=UPI00260B5514|nr:HK97 family phage prohead protease [uncultured Parasphingopyxis sp.]
MFDRADRGGDIIRPGAFARTLSEGRPIPLLWQHERGHVIGRIERLEEDGRGLRVIARVEDGTVRLRLAKGSGLSFGYRVRSTRHRTPAKAGAQYRPRATGPRPSPKARFILSDAAGGEGPGYSSRELLDLDLVEVSVVTIPMQPLARVHAVSD